MHLNKKFKCTQIELSIWNTPFLKFEVSGLCKDIYVLSNFAYYYYNMSNS